jgi:hypothetical protein
VRPGKGVHLSDGAHFENLGLYELVRRHCRYILVCDCGADTESAFDDVGNAIRRVRADFGVEITIDLEQLRPGEGRLARHHVAVGDIVYPEGEQGILVLLKPTLTGDEPNDVLQYRSRNHEFPQETTGDQFYDQAQWESYRRLGVHVAETALTPGLSRSRRTTIETDKRLERGNFLDFARLRSAWYPTPVDFNASYLDLTQRCQDIERAVGEAGISGLVQQVFPEVTTVTGPETPIAPADWPRVVELLTQIGQLMEDVLIGCRLNEIPNHPYNQGWINYFHRWAATPAFRMWWPVLRPTWSHELRAFVEKQFGLSQVADLDLIARLVDVTGLDGDSRLPRSVRARSRPLAPGDRQYEMYIWLEDGATPRYAVVGSASVRVVDERRAVVMDDRDFVIAPGFLGVGVSSWLLRELDRQIAAAPFAAGLGTFEVLITNTRLTDPASRQDTADRVQFFSQGGFRMKPDTQRRAEADHVTMVKPLRREPRPPAPAPRARA